MLCEATRASAIRLSRGQLHSTAVYLTEFMLVCVCESQDAECFWIDYGQETLLWEMGD